jgi:4-aminobutyrate aminotransferase-like enzyme
MALRDARAFVLGRPANSGGDPATPVVGGEGIWVQDMSGRRYMDLFAGAGVCSLGHSHPEFVEGLSRQLQAITVTRDVTVTRLELVQQLLSLLPPTHQRLGLFSTGSESVEVALRLAREMTGRAAVVSFVGGFHGRTAAAAAVSDVAADPTPMSALTAARLPYPRDDDTETSAANDDVLSKWREAARDQITATGSDIAAIIVEPIQGTAGNVIPAPGLLQAARILCDELGALLIADEIITGIGRTGTVLAVEREAVSPDIIVLGKGIGNGLPLSVVAVNERAAERSGVTWPMRCSSSSFGGNPLAMAAGLATLRIVERDALAQNAADVGRYWLQELRTELARRCPGVTVNGQGLMISLSLDMAVDTDDRAALASSLRSSGLVVGWHESRIRLNPPLTFTRSDAEDATTTLVDCIDRWCEAMGPSLSENACSGDRR